MYLDGRTITLSNVPDWRTQLGVGTSSDQAALTTRVSDLETSMVGVQAALASLQAVIADLTDDQDARLDDLEAANRVRYIYCPGDGRTYCVWLDSVDGEPDLNWAVSPIQLQLVEGEVILADVPVDTVQGKFDRLYDPTGVAYDLSALTVDGELTLDWIPA